MKQLLVVKDLLSQGKTVKILVRGNSMRPYLVHKRDYVLLHHSPTVQVGDVALAEISPSHFVLHRIVKLSGNEVTLRGDGNVFGTEQCKLSDICGIAIKFYRKGREKAESASSFRFRCYSWFWMNTRPLRRYILFLHRIFFHSYKDLTQ